MPTFQLLRIPLVLLSLSVVPLLTEGGIADSCPNPEFLRFLPSLTGGLYELLLHVPFCNGLLAYLFPVLVAVVLLQRGRDMLLVAMGCALLDSAVRVLQFGDEQWWLLMPAWKLVPTLLVLAATLWAKHALADFLAWRRLKATAE